jgi:hypothetical protein
MIYFYWHGRNDPKSTWETVVLNKLKGEITESDLTRMHTEDFLLAREHLQNTYNCWVTWAGYSIGIMFRDQEGYLAFKLTFL